MTFVISIVIIIGINNTDIIHQHQMLLHRHAAADMQAQELACLHIGLHTGRHQHQLARLQHNLFGSADIITGAELCLALRHRELNIHILGNLFKTTCFH